MQCCHYFAQPMREQGRGGLLLVNSAAYYGGANFLTTYSAIKAFDLCFAEGLWGELRGYGIDVLSMVLSQTDTPAYRKLHTENGASIPANLASPADVAAIGLAQLPHGPVYNWGQTNDVAGFAPSSPDMRRARILMIDERRHATFADK